MDSKQGESQMTAMLEVTASHKHIFVNEHKVVVAETTTLPI